MRENKTLPNMDVSWHAVGLLFLVSLASSSKIVVKDRNVDFIAVEWSIQELPTTDKGYKVSHKGGKTDYISNNEISKDSNSSTIYGLETNTEYNICVITLDKDGVHDEVECLKGRTLALIRTDSILVLLIILLYVVVCVVLGYAVWRWKKKKHGGENPHGKSEMEQNSYSHDVEDDGDSLNQGRYVKRGSRTLGMTNL